MSTIKTTRGPLVLTFTLVLFLLVPTAANAGFTRKFEGDITGTCPGLGETQQAGVCEPSDAKVTRFDPTGIAVAGSEELVVADGSASLAKFGPGPSSAFQGLLPLEGSAGVEGVAAERSMPGNDEFYVTHNLGKGSSEGTVESFEEHGKHVESWKIFEEPHVVVDNSTDPLDPSACGTMPPLSSEECTVYVVAEEGLERVLEKFNSRHVPEDFGALGTNKLDLGLYSRVGASVAVDAVGDIYVFGEGTVGVFAPSGQALAESFSIASPEVPPIGNAERGHIAGIAVDPVSGHLLVAVSENSHQSQYGAVDEFDIESGKFVAQFSATSEGGHLRNPGAMAVDSKGDVYVVDPNSGAVDVWGPGAYHPTVTLGVAGERAAGGAVLNGSVDPAQSENEKPAPLVECEFEYVEEAKYEQALAKKEDEGFVTGVAATAPCEAPDATEVQEKYAKAKGPYAVHAMIKAGLEPGHTYRYRLLAATEKGADNGGVGVSEAVRAFTEPALPLILSSSVMGVSLTVAQLHARIDPEGAETSYRFEYDTREYRVGEGSHGVAVPVPDGTLGAGGATGDAVESVVEELGGLTPGTTYFFRVVAANAVGPAAETAEGHGSFTTEPEVQRGAPDGRAYELVTPTEREGGSDLFAEPHPNPGEFLNEDDVGVPAESGEAFLLTTFDAFGSFPFADGQAYVFRREPAKGQWSYTSLADPTLGVQAFQNGGAFEAGALSLVAFNDGVGSKESTEGDHLADLAGPPGATALCPGGATLVVAESSGCYVELAREARVVGASQNLQHVVLEPNSATPAVCSDGTLCEWSGGYQTLPDGEVLPQLKPVDVNEEGEVIPCPAFLGAGILGGSSGSGSAYHAVSTTGSTVLFSAVTGAECKGAPQLFARVDGARTIELSEPGEGVKEPGQPGELPKQYAAQYVGASEDDSRVFFATETWLTEDHPTTHDLELYEWRSQHTEGAGGPCANPEGCLTRVSVPVQADGEPDPAAVSGLNIALAVAANGSAVYYTADGVLATNQTGGAHAEPGGCKRGNGQGACALYSYKPATAGAPAQTTFIATIPVLTFSHQGEAEVGVTPNPKETPAYTTPDGRYLLFQNGGNNDDGGPLYRYDSQTGSLVAIAAGSIDRSATQGGPATGPVRGMSDDGSYVFFDTTEQLVPQAKNQEGEHPELDTYEWHEDPATHAQTISLIGSGSSEAPTYFLGYSPYEYTSSEGKRVKVEGGNVFIGTHAQLSVQDTGSVGNVYDARVCEPDSPCIEPPPVGTRQCEDGGCQNPPAAPNDATPGSLTFTGPGDVSTEVPSTLPKTVTKKTVTCKKGLVKKKVKKKEVCVKSKSKKARKSSHGKGSH